MKAILAPALLCGVVAACITMSVADRAAQPASHEWIDSSAIDPSVSACQNFYRHACGGFIARTHVDERMPSVSLADQRFDANLESAMKRVLVDGLNSDDPEAQRLATFHTSCLASSAEPSTDVAIVRHWLARIDGVKRRTELAPLMREMAAIGAEPFFDYGGAPDPMNLTAYRGHIESVWLWGEASVVERAFTRAGMPADPARGEAQAVAALLTDLRKSLGNTRDFNATENPMRPEAIAEAAPSFDWPAYFAMADAPDAPINVTSPSFLRAVERHLKNDDLSILKAYLRWTFLFSLRGELPQPFVEAFGDIRPSARVAIADRAQYCRDASVRALGVEFSRQFAKHILGDGARREALAMAQEIRAAAVRSVADASWLSPSGRAATADKLAAVDLKIGYPDQWPTTGVYPVHADTFLENAIAARRFEQTREWRRAKGMRSRFDWELKVYPWVGEGMAAARLAIPNGFPDVYTNSMVVTAAFLVPPRFDARAPIEVNYGAYGAMLGHEYAHIATVHEFDRDGRFVGIWDARDIAAAETSGQCIIDQANAFEPAPGVKVDGKMQFNENVADYGGVRWAWEALKGRMGARLTQPDVEGATPAQRFFYAYAQSYCTAATETHVRESAATDVHGPVEFRVNAALSNLPGFAETFGCPAGAPMVRPPGSMCKVW